MRSGDLHGPFSEDRLGEFMMATNPAVRERGLTRNELLRAAEHAFPEKDLDMGFNVCGDLPVLG
eukprot:732079-Lingulodinium_polyedra.AAC.1